MCWSRYRAWCAGIIQESVCCPTVLFSAVQTQHLSGLYKFFHTISESRLRRQWRLTNVTIFNMADIIPCWQLQCNYHIGCILWFCFNALPDYLSISYGIFIENKNGTEKPKLVLKCLPRVGVTSASFFSSKRQGLETLKFRDVNFREFYFSIWEFLFPGLDKYSTDFSYLQRWHWPLLLLLLNPPSTRHNMTGVCLQACTWCCGHWLVGERGETYTWRAEGSGIACCMERMGWRVRAAGVKTLANDQMLSLAFFPTVDSVYCKACCTLSCCLICSFEPLVAGD